MLSHGARFIVTFLRWIVFIHVYSQTIRDYLIHFFLVRVCDCNHKNTDTLLYTPRIQNRPRMQLITDIEKGNINETFNEFQSSLTEVIVIGRVRNRWDSSHLKRSCMRHWAWEVCRGVVFAHSEQRVKRSQTLHIICDAIQVKKPLAASNYSRMMTFLPLRITFFEGLTQLENCWVKYINLKGTISKIFIFFLLSQNL